ncbi:unnamed protein product [Orchesella dallaii]|uniref:F-box domain-containing protein n=1 Tax=Orchesella dallaii TaxID=48710 RepID=A0ABP1PL07_9HEXA
MAYAAPQPPYGLTTLGGMSPVGLTTLGGVSPIRYFTLGGVPISTLDSGVELSCVFPELVWKKILSHVKDPNDALALLNTSPFFNQRMKELQLFSQIIPILMKGSHLNLSNTLKCRVLTKKTQLAVDDAFWEISSANTPHSFPTPSTRNDPYMITPFPFPSTPFYDGPNCFINDQELLRFTNHFRGTSNKLVNPFFQDHVKLWISNALFFNRVIEMLARFGHLIRKLELNMNFINIPGTLMERLIMALNHVPNLESLCFTFKPFPLGLDVIVPNQGNVGVEQVVRMPSPEELPKLYHLVELDISLLIGNGRRATFLDVFRRILEAYGQQLSKLVCKDTLIGNWGLIPMEIFSSQLTNLKELTLYGQFADTIGRACQTLSQIRLPNLVRLNVDFVFSVGVALPQEFVEALNHLRNTLEVLALWWKWDSHQPEPLRLLLADPPVPLLTLPKLKSLYLHNPDLNSNLWNVFQTQLINLEHVELRNIHRRNWRSIEESILPQPSFFSRFQTLRKFVLTNVGYGGMITTEITRMDFELGQKTVTVNKQPYVREFRGQRW